MITKQTFEALAASIKRQVANYSDGETTDYYAVLIVREIAEDCANHFAQSNPRFDRVRFLNACGLTEAAQEHANKLRAKQVAHQLEGDFIATDTP